MNRLKILEAIIRGADSRISIAEETGISLPSVTNMLSFLMEENLVVETGTEEVDRGGRRSVLLEFHAAAYDLICIKLDIAEVTIALTDLNGAIKNQVTRRLKQSDPLSVVHDLKKELDSFFKKFDCNKVLAVGIGVSGLVLNQERLLLSTSLKWTGFDLKHAIQEHIKKPVVIENISATNGLFLFHRLKKSQQDKNIIYIEMENGIGATQIYNGSINRTMIGEIGHTTVERNGEKCFCGNKGCLEVMCSADKMIALATQSGANELSNAPVTIDKIITAMKTNQKIRRIVNRCGEYLGIATANMIHIFNPQKIIINDAQYRNTDYIYKYIIKFVKKRVNPVLLEDLTFENASISEDEKITGIARYLTTIVFDILW